MTPTHALWPRAIAQRSQGSVDRTPLAGRADRWSAASGAADQRSALRLWGFARVVSPRGRSHDPDPRALIARSLNVRGVPFVAHNWRVEPTVGRLLPVQPTNGRLYVCGVSRGWPYPSGPGCIPGPRSLNVRRVPLTESRPLVGCFRCSRPTVGSTFVGFRAGGVTPRPQPYPRPARSDRARSLNVRKVPLTAHPWRVEPTVGRLLPMQPTNGRLYRGSRGGAYPCGPGISPTVSPS